MSKPTPGPWMVERGGELMPPNERLIVAMLGKNENGIQMIRTIGRTYGFAGPDESVANASLIVRAVNCHADLVAALEDAERLISALIQGSPAEAIPIFQRIEIARKCRAALAKALEP